ncbi:22084_t:CDS:2, partial [Racocetra persica]
KKSSNPSLRTSMTFSEKRFINTFPVKGENLLQFVDFALEFVRSSKEEKKVEKIVKVENVELEEAEEVEKVEAE